MAILNPRMIEAQIQKGRFDPHLRLTNISTGYFQSLDNRPAKALFPIVPVQLSTSSYYKFDKGDLLRDTVREKPQFGRVDPSIVSHTTDTYSVTVFQDMQGIDQISQLDYSRTNAPGAIQAQNAKSRVLAQKMAIHQDNLFGDAYFKSGKWSNEWAGVESNPTGKQFIKFTSANSDPIKFFRSLITDMERETGYTPNKLGLGAETFDALANHPAILERINGASSTTNPALVTESILSTLLGIPKVVRFSSIQNNAAFGNDADMNFICDPTAALLVYAPDAPAIDTPSAGYIFTWDMLGDGQFLPVMMGEGEFGTFAEYITGLMAYDMKKVSDDLGVFLTDCV